jgi:hypothetical protein
MKVTLVIACAVGALGLSCVTAVHAQSLRCNGDLAGVGDTKASLMNKCGKPALTDWYCKPVPQVWQQSGVPGGAPIPVAAPCERIDEWTYYPGYGQFVTTFRFESSVVREVRYGDRIN